MLHSDMLATLIVKQCYAGFYLKSSQVGHGSYLKNQELQGHSPLALELKISKDWEQKSHAAMYDDLFFRGLLDLKTEVHE